MKRPSRRALLAGSLALALAPLVSLIVRPPAIRAAPARYGADQQRTQSAVTAAAWPQQSTIWCGVATIAAVARFRGQAVSQGQVAGYLNSGAARSQWGTPGSSPDNWGPSFAADISRDAGTDPRALAAGLSGEAGAQYHQYVVTSNRYAALRFLASDLIRTQEPVSVIVHHGLHSVVVAAVNANGNPLNSIYNITSIEVWDPGVGSPDQGIQPAQMMEVPLDTFLSSDWYWGRPYDWNWVDGRADDPDPAVGPYAYGQPNSDPGALWIGNYVYLRRDGPGVGPDWAFNQNLALIRGHHGEIPSGYTGPTAPIWTPPPTPTPVPPTPTPTITPTPTATPRPLIDHARPDLDDLSSTPTTLATTQPTRAPSLFSPAGGGAMLWFGGAALAGALLLVAGVGTVTRKRARAADQPPDPIPPAREETPPAPEPDTPIADANQTAPQPDEVSASQQGSQDTAEPETSSEATERRVASESDGV
jgi:hypothetical protein